MAIRVKAGPLQWWANAGFQRLPKAVRWKELLAIYLMTKP
jgi:hypothetical protein